MPRLRLVIDASVAGRAGTSVAPSSKANRRLLREVRKVCHRLVMNREISGEWGRHQSNFSSVWYSSMASKGKVERLRTRPDQEIRDAIEQVDSGRAAMRKDAPLLEAALKADGVVISTDDRAHTRFASLSHRVERLQPIVWVNPELETEGVLRWLRRGGHPRPEWRLRWDYS